ncbi:MAG TPA: methyltransferase domain-containing protein, partial [Caulobacteraceae bacterium]
MAETATANSDQVAYWNAGAGETWTAMQDKLDGQIQPLGEAAIEALGLKAGERVVDIGCGCGQTTVALASQVGAAGAVLGVDISRPMLVAARRRLAAQGLAQAGVIEADAQTHPFAAAAFDAVFSRFGVMFFEDPTAAFGNILKGLKPGGRLGFVCWRTFAENPWMSVPLAAAQPLLPEPASPPTDPLAPGPFAFADPDRLQAILSAAGFADISVTAQDKPIGAPTLDAAIETALKVGPLGARLREHPDQAATVVGAIRQALA